MTRIRRGIWRAALLGLIPFAALMRSFPMLAALWGSSVSRPLLRALSDLSLRLPFSLLEWGTLALGVLLAMGFLWRLLRRGIARASGALLRRIGALLICLLWSFLALWLPLYRLSPAPPAPATARQLEAVCEELISELNMNVLSDYRSAAPLPAKLARFPFWLKGLHISGFFAFPTGEALISPELEGCAAPFVAVHEAMHARGIAGEGAANIAAYTDCLRRGGEFAASAKLWALHYGMQQLREQSEAAFERCLSKMSDPTFRQFRAVGGGGRTHPHEGVRRLFRALGIGTQSEDYENLAFWLASREDG